jgi:hypothetical protein
MDDSGKKARLATQCEELVASALNVVEALFAFFDETSYPRALPFGHAQRFFGEAFLWSNYRYGTISA